MITRLIPTVTVIAAVGCGMAAGLLFVFSVFMMRTLDGLPPGQGMTAMQSINVTILNPLFGLMYFGTALLCLLLLVTAPFTRDQGGVGWRVAGALLFLVGAIVVTIAFNVPLNDQLAATDAYGPDGAAVWKHYVSTWTAWNHVRTVAACAAAVVLTLASRM